MASHIYTLPTLTPGVWAKLQLAADTAAFMFKNDSVYDFLLVFGGTLAPNFQTSPGGQANAFVNALEYPVVYVQHPGASAYEQQLNAVGAWDGNLWYLCQDNTGGLATTGTISGRIVVNVQTYGPLDPVPPSGQAVTRQVDLTSQTRLIHIPMTPFACYSWADNATTGNDYSPFPATVALTNPSTDTGCVVYLYGASVAPQTTAGNLSFAINLIFRDFTTPATILGTADLVGGSVLWTANGGYAFVYTPAYPFSVQLFRGGSLPANTGIIEVAMHDYGSTAAFPFRANVQIDSDKLSPGQVRVPGIGQGLNPSQYAAGVPKF